MSLQLKFAVLLAALAAAVLIALGTARWSLDVTYREVRQPVQSGSDVLLLLFDIEKHVDHLRGMLDPGDSFRARPLEAQSIPHPPIDRPAFDLELDRLDSLLRLIREEQWVAYTGRGASDNFSAKVAEFRLTCERYFLKPEAVAVGQLSASLFRIHELLKLMERRVVVDMRALTVSGQDLRFRLGIVLGLALALVVLTASLGFLLMRRWVVRPVADLRAAAARIAAGDFEHRIPIRASAARDEMISLSTEVNHMAGMVKQLQGERVEQERLAAIGELMRRLAHNLRNPLAGIRGLAELSRAEAKSLGPTANEVTEAQTRIIVAVDRFEGWLSDLLNVTTPAHVSVEPTATEPWLAGLVDAHRPLAQTRGVVMELDQSQAPLTALIDTRHLEHAISALLSNAIEASAAHARSNTKPTVRIQSKVAENGKLGQIWELRVEDNGPGVPPDLRESVFKPYFTTKKDGNGIGLAVTQQVVRAHGGKVSIEDAPSLTDPPTAVPSPLGHPKGGGAAFVIRLPLEIRPAAATISEMVANTSQ